MKLWSAFYPDLLPELPMAPLPVVDHWIRNVVADFCERTKAYVADLDAQDSVALQMSYSPILPVNTTLVEILSVQYDGEPIDFKSRHGLQLELGAWEAETGDPSYWTQQRADQVMLVPAPENAVTGGIKIKAALKPGDASTGIEDWIFNRWRLKIASGVKASMMVQADKPWTNIDQAAIHAAVYEAAVAEATPAASGGYSRQSTPRFSGSFC